MKKYILFDHDGVLVDTEPWYYRAGERALADIGFTLDKDRYLREMRQGLGTWAQARAAGIDEPTISRQRDVRDRYYQEYLRTEPIEIDGVVEGSRRALGVRAHGDRDDREARGLRSHPRTASDQAVHGLRPGARGL